MSKIEKLILRLFSLPKDFTYSEMVKVLNYFGFAEAPTGKTGGSRVRFKHLEYPIDDVFLHKPHPNNILKRYQLEIIIRSINAVLKIEENEEN